MTHLHLVVDNDVLPEDLEEELEEGEPEPFDIEAPIYGLKPANWMRLVFIAGMVWIWL